MGDVEKAKKEQKTNLDFNRLNVQLHQVQQPFSFFFLQKSIMTFAQAAHG